MVRQDRLTQTCSWDNNDVNTDPARSRAARITVRRFASSAEAERHDLEFWLQIPADQRVLQVWRLSEEQWRLRGDPPHEPGLCRSVARIHRS